jgi:steroid delta-isomerase-like uncharacterized protein
MSSIEQRTDNIRAAWNNHDASDFASQFSPDAVLRYIATGEVVHGREQIQGFVAVLLEAFPDLRLDRRNTYGCGERVRVIEWTITATHNGQFLGVPPTHRSVELHGCSIFVLGADGFVSEETVYLDAATMLRQLDVLPASANA